MLYFLVLLSQEHAFGYIQNVMVDDAFTDLEREEVREAALDSLQASVAMASPWQLAGFKRIIRK